MIYREGARIRMPMARWKKISLAGAGVIAVGVACFLWIPRTAPYRVNHFQNYQDAVLARHAAWEATRAAGGSAPFPTPTGLLEKSITPEQARKMLYPKSLPFEALPPEQQRLFLQVPAPGQRWAKSVNPLRLSVYEQGIMFYWIVDGKELSRAVGDKPPPGP